MFAQGTKKINSAEKKEESSPLKGETSSNINLCITSFFILSEATSDYSDIEGRIRALNEELRKQKQEAEDSRRKKKKKMKEKLKEQEKDLRKAS